MRKRKFRRRPKWGPKPSSTYIARTQDDLRKKRGARAMPVGVKRAFCFSKARIKRIALFGRRLPGDWLIRKMLRKLFPPPQIPSLPRYRVIEYRGERQTIELRKGDD